MNPPVDPARSAPRSGALRAWARLMVAVAARAYLVFAATLVAIATIPMLLGWNATVVLSGSMRPAIDAGDVVVTSPHRVGTNDLDGRVVTFHRPALHGGTEQVLHRLVAREEDGRYRSAGDANADLDVEPVAEEQVRGLGRLLVPWVGLPAHWSRVGAAGPFGTWLALTAAAIAVELAEARAARRRRADDPDAPGARGAAAAPVAVAALLVAASLPQLVGAGTPGLTMARGLPGGPVLSTAEAAFTAHTRSVGSQWSTAPVRKATHLAFAVQPGDGTGGSPLAAQPVVELRDAHGRPVSGRRTVRLALVDGAGTGATLHCDAEAIDTADGTAHFTGCRVDRVGTYRLVATSTSLPPVVSAPFQVSPGPGVALRFAAAPGPSEVDRAFDQQPVVEVVDAGGNRATDHSPITVYVADAAVHCATNPTVAQAGQAAFWGCRIDRAGTYRVMATGPGFEPVASAPFVVARRSPGLACSSLVWYATFSWSPTPQVPTTYRLYVNEIEVPATGADGWNSYVQLSSSNVPAWRFPEGPASVRVTKVLAGGGEELIGTGTVVLGPANHRTYTC